MALEDFELKFFEHLKAEFLADFSAEKTPQADLAREIIQRYETSKESLIASDVYALEILLLGMQPTERLIQLSPGLRSKYHELAGDKDFAAYKPAAFPEKLDDAEARRPLLADLHQILNFLHWSYLFSPIRERLRTRLIVIALWSILGYSVLAAVLIYLFYRIHHPFLAVFTIVLYSGIIGGFISSQRRLQMIPTTGDPLSGFYELRNGQYFLWFAPLTGGIFALVLMLIFIGKILQGIIFPEFLIPAATPADIAGGWWGFMTQLLPKESKDYALLFLWSFVAGFGERFVPDALDRIIVRAQAAPSSTVAAGTQPVETKKVDAEAEKAEGKKTLDPAKV